MTHVRSIAMMVILCALVLFAFPPRAQAYLDPGTSSYLVQVLVAGLLAGAVAVKVFWRNIRGFFEGLLRRGGSPVEETRDEQ